MALDARSGTVHGRRNGDAIDVGLRRGMIGTPGFP
jgi:hypothetical protein